MPAFGLTIFWGAFLLFAVQPLMAKYILPWFGGSAAVWTTCMLFFQVLLLGGYAYAHGSISRLTARRQVALHLGLIAVALLSLPIAPGESWKPPDSSQPTWRILLLLGATLGLPYLVLSATGPLMQAWFSRARPGASPYRLYALSNVGSLLALVSYPTLWEGNLSRTAQSSAWSVGFGIYAIFAVWCGVILWKRAGQAEGAESREATEASETPGQQGGPRWLWFALPACASVLLLAVTNKISQDIAVIPFLWVLPLSVYLISFIISFDSPRWYRRHFWSPALLLALAAVLWVMIGENLTAPKQPWLKSVAWLIEQRDDLSMRDEILVYVAALFVFCMVCHGELYRLRPEAKRLSGYYLMVAAGGAFGGLCVAVVAPLFFKNYFELHVGIFATALLFAAVLCSDPASGIHRGRPRWALVLIVAVLTWIGWGLYRDTTVIASNALEMTRSFYGVLKIFESETSDPEEHRIVLQHGGTTHGYQHVSPVKHLLPTSYYTRSSGVGRTLTHFPRQTGRRVGIVGLGTGTLATYGEEGDYFRFYEIDENVRRIARSRFTFLNRSRAAVDVVLGDARLSMEREEGEPFDILILDAFSSDAIPVHLLTEEAFHIYERRLKPDGVIAVHISNRYLNLEPVVLRIADHMKWRTVIISNGDGEPGDDPAAPGDGYDSDWVLLSRNEEFLGHPGIANAASAPIDHSLKVKLWTDDESSLWPILDIND